MASAHRLIATSCVSLGPPLRACRGALSPVATAVWCFVSSAIVAHSCCMIQRRCGSRLTTHASRPANWR
eukprot:1298523-Heterocapsa_arctica.AAC.1